MGALSDFVRERFGVDVRFNPVALATVAGTTATQIWRANADRLELTFINLGATTIYIFVDPSVSSSKGIYLAGGGGAVVLTAGEDGELVGYPWYAVSSVNCNMWSAEVEGY